MFFRFISPDKIYNSKKNTLIELRLKKTLLRLDFSFFAVIALFLFLDSTGFGMSALFACALHELSHLLIMLMFGISPEIMTFYGAGIRITSSETQYAAMLPRLLILSAGCAANFAAFALFWLNGAYAPAVINLFIGIFNLLPVGELDGAALLRTVLIRLCAAEKIDRCMKTAAILSSVMIFAAVILFGGGISFTLITTALYLLIVSSRYI